MAKLNNLNDDCLLAVFDWLSHKELFLMQRVNKKMKRLAEEKIHTKIKVISLWRFNSVSDCSHLGAIDAIDQVLDLKTMLLKDQGKNKIDCGTRFLNVLSKCAGVKSIDFGDCEFLDGLLLEVARRCPQIECIKISKSIVKEDEWVQALDLIGHQLMHLKKERHFISISEARLLELVASKCPNIKQLDWWASNLKSNLNSDLMTAFKLLPKSCWVILRMKNQVDFENNFEDIFNEMDVCKLSWSPTLRKRIERLSSLTMAISFELSDLIFGGIDFAVLKKLDVCRTETNYSQMSVSCLLACCFPLLEEFGFNATIGYTENDYERLFSKMPSVKKLIISCSNYPPEPRLPGSAIRQLNKLETIELKLEFLDQAIPDDWEPVKIFRPLNKYVNDIGSWKMLAVKIDKSLEGLWTTTVVEELSRLWRKQDRVHIDLSCRYDLYRLYHKTIEQLRRDLLLQEYFMMIRF